MLRTASILIVLVCLSSPTWAVPVNSEHPSGVAAIDLDSLLILCSNGMVWSYESGSDQWTRASHFDPPIAVSDIRDWGPHYLLANDGTLWRRLNDSWMSCSAVPCEPPVTSETESLGSLKQMFR